jgi:hypothetical protein
MKLYFVELTWYNDFNEDEESDSLFAFGENIVEVASHIDDAYSNIINISIKEINDACTPYVFYLPKNTDFSLIEELTNANNY